MTFNPRMGEIIPKRPYWKLNTSSTASSAVNIRLSFGFKSFFPDSFEARLKSRKKTERRHDDKFVRTLNYYLRKIYVK